jgi:hypothetical protein
MRYMLLMHGPQALWRALGALPPADARAHRAFLQELERQLVESGELVERASEALGGPERAQLVRARGRGGPLVARAPFPEAQPFLAGYWIVDCDSPARAAAIAARLSAAPGPGGAPLDIAVEVRPVMSAPGEEM